MSEHLSTAQLQDYGSRALPPREASRVVAHLDGCAACFAAYRALFPADPQREVALEDDEPFHLDYEQHLQPFVDGETDEVENEIITSHVAVCPPCGQALRDLQEFRDSLRWQQAAQAAPGPWARLSAWWQAHSRAVLWKSFAWALGLLLILGGGVWFVWRRQAAPPDDLARAATPTPAPVATPTPHASPALSPTPNVRPAETAPPEDEPPPGAPTEVAQAIRAQKLSFPPELNGLGVAGATAGQQRGTDDPPPADHAGPTPTAPLGVARERRPLFRWQPTPGASSYVVTIADEQNNELARSPVLSNTAWRPAAALPPGRRLRWQVAASTPAGGRAFGPTANFYTLSAAAETRLRATEQATASALARGVAYAQAGLLDEAEQAFRAWLRQHPRSVTGRTLLEQVTAQRRR
jgi:hypothetical protein